MQLPRSDPQRAGVIEKRTLQNIQDDYDQFVADGSCSSRQKFYHNAIHEKLLDIELGNVKICFSSPHLHRRYFSLGFPSL